MTCIFYGLAGEGLGHASRTLSVIDHLPGIDVHLFTFGKAYDFLQKIGYPHLHLIEGIMFEYNKDRVSYSALTKRVAKYWIKDLKNNIEYIKKQAEIFHPQLFISDFEPSIPRAAKKVGSTLISVDNQHRFAYVDLVDLPLFLRAYGWCCGLAAKAIVPNPQHTVISTFHYDYIKPKGKNVYTTNGLLRKSLTEQTTRDDNFLLVYVRKSVNDIFLNAIKDIHHIRIKVYGATQRSKNKNFNIEYFDIGPNFVNDLVSCSCLLSTSGNQLVSEARYFGKHCLLVPEPGQYEQSINSYYAVKLGIAQECPANKLNKEKIVSFFNEKKPTFNTVPNGVNTVVEVIRRSLESENRICI